jgi:hypothetical protein
MNPGDTITPANFDADLSPDHEVNRRAAKVRRVTYDPRSRTYRDSDGCHVYDKFGQPLG